jgi:transposase
VCRLSGAQLERLRDALGGGPALWGWDEDQRWRLGRVTALNGRLFHVRYTLRGTSLLLHRIGFSPQAPAPGRGARRGGHRGVAGCDLAHRRYEASGGDRRVCVL